MSEKIELKTYKQALNKAYLNLRTNATLDNVLDTYSICEYLLRAYPKYNRQCFLATQLCKDILTQQPDFLTDKAMQKLWWQILYLEGTHEHLDSALIYLERYREPEKRFYEPRRDTFIKHGIVQNIQKLIDGDIDLLTISLVPRGGKTTLEIFLMTLMGGWYPDDSILCVSYAEPIIKMFYDTYMQIITDKYTYAWQEMFGKKVKLESQNAKDTYINLGRSKNYKTFTTRSIDGSLTGAVQAQKLLVCDDLIKNQEEALNKNRLQKLWESYTVNLLQRKKEGCRELHIATRWSVYDPIGRIQIETKDNARNVFLSVPALDKNGESNFDYPYNVGFSTKYYLDLKEKIDPISFNCLYMQEPVEREGLLFEEEKLRLYYELPSDKPDCIWATCDTKDKGSDFVSMPIGYQYGDDIYIEDVFFTDSTDYEYVDNGLAQMLINHKVNRCLFESNNAGGRVASDVQKILDQNKTRISLQTKFTRTNKETKILTNSDYIMKHFLFKAPEKRSKQYQDFINQIITYTAKGKNIHDDAPDSACMMSEFIIDGQISKAVIMKSLI